MLPLINSLFRRNCHPKASKRKSSHLNIELLEDRTLMSTVTYTFVNFGSNSVILGSNPEGLQPSQVRSAYGLNSASFNDEVADGKGQTIAIVEPYNDPSVVADLDAFDSKFAATSGGLTLQQQYGSASSFLKVLDQTGKVINAASTSVPVDVTGQWAQETAMDVEWAHAIAPGAKIDLVECNSTSTKDLYQGVTTAATLSRVSVVSMSWGVNEASNENLSDSTFSTPTGHTGVTFVAPSGDTAGSGSYPAYSPNVVAVGGTSLVVDGQNAIQSETAWAGSGSGTSAFQVEPAYQLGVQNTGHRSIPDVAFDADPHSGVAVYCSSSQTALPWIELGGTSLGTPAWGGLFAIANQRRVLAGQSTLNSSANPTQSLTALYSLPNSDFHVDTGSISNFTSGPKYDPATGLGTPAADRLIPDLVSYRTPTHLVVTTQPGANSITGKAFTVVVQAQDGSGHVLKSFTGTVTLSLLDNSGGSTLGGSPTVQAVKGQATFKGLKLSKSGTGYQLLAASSTLPSATTVAFNEAAGAVTKTTAPSTLQARAMDDYEQDDSYTGDTSTYLPGDFGIPYGPYQGGQVDSNQWYGNYLGPGNAGWDTYPINSLDAAARNHDIAYDLSGANGVWGALTNTSVSGDDWTLASNAFNSLWNDPSLSSSGQAWAAGTATVFGGLAIGKEFYNTGSDYLNNTYNSFSNSWNSLANSWNSWNGPSYWQSYADPLGYAFGY